MATTSTNHQATKGFDRIPDILEQLFQSTVELPVPAQRPAERVGGMPCNLIETWANYYLQVALPGIDPERLDVQVEGRKAIVKGKYAFPEVDNGTYLWHGMAEGEFSEVFPFPAEVDGDKAEAQYERGVLTVRLPKVDYLKPKSVKVQTAK